MPRSKFGDGQEVAHEDFDSLSGRVEMEVYDRVMYEVLGRQKDVVFGDSFAVSYVNNTTVQVKLGNGIQYDNTQVDPEPMMRRLFVAANTNKTITTPDATNNRIDIICIKA